MSTIYLPSRDLPEGYGAFDEDQNIDEINDEDDEDDEGDIQIDKT